MKWLSRFTSHHFHVPLDFKNRMKESAPFIFWPLTIAWLIGSLSSSISQEIIDAESAQQNFIKSRYSIVAVKQDYQKASRTPLSMETLTRVRRMAPDTSFLILADVDIEFSPLETESDHLLSHTVRALLVSEDFFNAANGSLENGRLFTDSEISTKQPYGVITPGLVEALFGSEDAKPRTLFIEGRQITIVGRWKFTNDQIEENQVLILPYTLLSWIGDSERTAVSKFIVPNAGIKTLEPLKRTLDQLQLESGSDFVRPNFQLVTAAASERNTMLWQLRKTPAEWMAIMMALLAIICCAFGWEKLLQKNQVSLAWLSIAQPNPIKRWTYLMRTFSVAMLLWVAMALFASFLLLFIFSSRFQVEPSFSFPRIVPFFILTLGALGAISWINWKFVIRETKWAHSLERL